MNLFSNWIRNNYRIKDDTRGYLCDNCIPSFLHLLIINWRTFSRRVTARWWHQSAKNQQKISVDQSELETSVVSHCQMYCRLIWNLKQGLTVKYFHVLKICDWCHYNKMWRHDSNAWRHIWFLSFSSVFDSVWDILFAFLWHSNLGKTDQNLVTIMFIILYGLITKNLSFKYLRNFCKAIVKVSYSDVITALLFFAAYKTYKTYTILCRT